MPSLVTRLAVVALVARAPTITVLARAATLPVPAPTIAVSAVAPLVLTARRRVGHGRASFATAITNAATHTTARVVFAISQDIFDANRLTILIETVFFVQAAPQLLLLALKHRKDVIDLTDFFRIVPLVELHEACTVLRLGAAAETSPQSIQPLDQNAAAASRGHPDSDERQWHTG